MNKHPKEQDIFTERAFTQINSPLWPEGPSYKSLLDRFVRSGAEAAALDTWIPLGSPKTQSVILFFFQGAALQLADKLFVHKRIAMMALIFSAMELFPSMPPVEVAKLITDLPIPFLDGKDKAEGFHMLGASSVDQWLYSGLDTTPPTTKLIKLKEMVEQFAVPDALNPDGAADLATKLTQSETQRKAGSDDKEGR